ncbi:MAG: hypothetical protein H6Q12_939 [Bacteroidetes bacterium]|nr:hypothetical protein [Bacteroidota bacterium]
MKQHPTLKLLIVLICLFLSSSSQAQIVSRTIHIEKAGTLSTLIPLKDKYLIEELILSGNLNGTDIKYIREMTGGGEYCKMTNGKLIKLNLEDVNIVAGGIPYYWYDCTENNCVSNNMFFDLEQLNSIILPRNIIAIGVEAFNLCTGLKAVNIGNNVSTICRDAFAYCPELTTIAIPESVTSIGESAFWHCSSLTSITIPNRVISIGVRAFEDCTELSEIHCKAKNPPIICSSTFDKSKNRLKLYISKGSSKAYKSAEGWKEFTNIIEE